MGKELEGEGEEEEERWIHSNGRKKPLSSFL